MDDDYNDLVDHYLAGEEIDPCDYDAYLIDRFDYDRGLGYNDGFDDEF